MTRSVLFFTILPGRRDEFVAAFMRIGVLRRASKQEGFRRSQLQVPVDGRDEAPGLGAQVLQGGSHLGSPVRVGLAGEHVDDLALDDAEVAR